MFVTVKIEAEIKELPGMKYHKDVSTYIQIIGGQYQRVIVEDMFQYFGKTIEVWIAEPDRDLEKYGYMMTGHSRYYWHPDWFYSLKDKLELI